MRFSPCGKFVAAGGTDKTVKIYDVASGNIVQSLEGHSYPISTVIYSENGKYIYSSG